MNEYIIIDPARRRVMSKDTWIESVTEMCKLSLETGVMYEVVSLRGTSLPYPRERRRVLNDLAAYIEQHNSQPGTLTTYHARRRYESSVRHLNQLMLSYRELIETDHGQRRLFTSHYPRIPDPVK